MTTAERARRLLGTTHHGAGSRLGDLTEALRRLEAAEQDWHAHAPIPRSRCGSCGHLSVVSGYMCSCCGCDCLPPSPSRGPEGAK